MRPLRVFLCHASQDKPAVWKLHRYLKQRGVQPWLDQADLLPGQNWEVEIPKALFTSDVILVCLSKNSVNKEGYVQKEIAFALDKAMEKPEGTIFIIPVKLEECEVPRRLGMYQWVDYYRTDGRKRLLMGLNKRVVELDDEVTPVIKEDSRQRTQVPQPETRQEEHIVLLPQKEEIKDELKKEPPDQIPPFYVEEERGDDGNSVRKKPFIKLLDLSSLFLQGVSPSKINAQGWMKFVSNKTVRWLGMGGIGALALWFVILGGNAIFNNLPSSETPVSAPSLTITSAITHTAILPTYTLPPPPTFTPTPDIGSTVVSAKDGMVLVYVPAGEFIMGASADEGYEDCLKFFIDCDRNLFIDEQPIHTVLLDSFWIDRTEVTNAMYAKCEADDACPRHTETSFARASYYDDAGYNDYPVVNVSWNTAAKYCAWAGRRLPTEAEWEKAARGVDGKLYPWGSDFPVDRRLNFNRTVGDTTPVGYYPDGASDYGTLDMAGNVYEWVNDWYESQYYWISPQSNPQGPDEGDGNKVLRGGSFIDLRYLIRSANRVRGHPDFSDPSIGFRCARSP